MAHSPIPMSSIMHQSPSPLFNPQPLTKRDKKRQAVEQRIKEISDTFAAQRESHLRNQLNALHRDIQFVNRAEVYTNKPLDEIADDVFSDIASQQGSVDGESKAPALGRLAAEFVEDVNDALEERDASITATHDRFNDKLSSLQLDFRFTVESAEAEHRSLRHAARERLASLIRAKKKQLQKEKEMLDSADYSTLVNNYQFALTQPASPSGIHGNRKTRNTRRNDWDIVDRVDGVRKKRPMMADTEPGSPMPGSRLTHDVQTSALWEKQEMPDNGLTLQHYFSARELNMHNKHARDETARTWASKRMKNHLPNSKTTNYTIRQTNGHISDAEDGGEGASDEESLAADRMALVAPAMDRTGSSHATRSTRNQQPTAESVLHYDAFENGGVGGQDPQRVYGAAVIDAQALRNQLKDPGSKDFDIPGLAGFSVQEQSEDWAFISSQK